MAAKCLASGFVQIKDTSLVQRAVQIQQQKTPTLDFTSDEACNDGSFLPYAGINDGDEVMVEAVGGEKRKLEDDDMDIEDVNNENSANQNGYVTILCYPEVLILTFLLKAESCEKGQDHREFEQDPAHGQEPGHAVERTQTGFEI